MPSIKNQEPTVILKDSNPDHFDVFSGNLVRIYTAARSDSDQIQERVQMIAAEAEEIKNNKDLGDLFEVATFAEGVELCRQQLNVLIADAPEQYVEILTIAATDILKLHVVLYEAKMALWTVAQMRNYSGSSQTN